MTPKFRISRADLRTLTVTGVHPLEDSTIYEDEFTTDEGKFTYLETTSINALYQITADEEETLIGITVANHYSDQMELSLFDITKDSLYIVKHIVLPNLKWIQEYIDGGITTIEDYCEVYYYDTDNDKLMYRSFKDDKSISSSTVFEEVTDCEKIFLVNLESDVYSVYKEELYTFMIPDLQTCLYNVSNSLLELLCPKNCNDSSLSDATYNRDLLWMSINVIKYQLDLGNYYKAQSILEEIENCCSGICNSNNQEGGSGCGCSKNS